MHRLLLIDDDEALAGPLAQYLARFDLQLEAVTRPSAALQRLATQPFDALILDGMLPEMDGFEFCKRLRAGSDAWRDIPVLMLTARGDLTDRVVGLELGADDYLPKPFEPRELAARLQTILRRTRLTPAAPPATPQPSAGKLCFEGLEIDTARREVRCASGLVELTGTEYELLLMLAREPGRVFSRDDILNRLRGQEAELFTRAVDILVSRLRRKLEPLAVLKTLRNAGYCFALPGKLMKTIPYDHRWRERWERKKAKRARRMGRDWEYRWRVRHRWHQRWHHQHARFKHSLGARLIAIFILLACVSSAILWTSMGSAYGLLWAVPALLLVTGVAFGMIRHMVWPLHALALGAEAFRRGEFSYRVPVIHADEIGDLAQRFNQMAADIQAMLDGKRALLLALSHELRSPLTQARLHAELVGEGASRDALLQELAQMRDLITALLESERLGSGHSALQLGDCDLAALAREQAQPGLALLIEPGLPVLQLDRLRVQLCLRNLVQNALRHNDPARGDVQLHLAREGTGVRLTVRDFGPGVPPESLAQLGQPFYRPDAARTRHDGGVGLGLCLCRLVAEAHGGQLQLRNAESGFEASVRFS